MIPYCIEKAIRFSVSGRPGAVYLDIPGDVLMGSAEYEHIPRYLGDIRGCA